MHFTNRLYFRSNWEKQDCMVNGEGSQVIRGTLREVFRYSVGLSESPLASVCAPDPQTPVRKLPVSRLTRRVEFLFTGNIRSKGHAHTESGITCLRHLFLNVWFRSGGTA